MSKALTFLAASAVTALFLTGAVGSAEAKPGPHCCKGHHNHWHAWRHGGFYKHYYVTTGVGCGWLWRRYLATGINSYKYRYYECIGD